MRSCIFSFMKKCVNSLQRWFLENSRSLPWRENRTPYTVWISEVMLQQTQVDRVRLYFNAWLKAYPDIESLAAAKEDAVLKLWEGLGYYSRARNLILGAKYLVTHHNGKLPETVEELQKIPSFGPYTVSALRAFAYHHKTLAIDANVARVLSRFFCITEDITKEKTKRVLTEKGTIFLEIPKPCINSEALIELGALICTKRNPRCTICPLKEKCEAYAKNLCTKIPYKARKIVYEKLFRDVCLIIFNKKVLLHKVSQKALMKGLYEFPYFESQEEGSSTYSIIESIQKHFGLSVSYEKSYDVVLQSFTRFRAKLYPKIFSCEKAISSLPEDYYWYDVHALETLAFSSGAKKIVDQLLTESQKML